MANSSSEKLKLYSYWRRSCAHRVRIALAFKGLEYEYIPVNFLKGGKHDPDFKKINPMGTVPALVDEDVVIIDSFAIIMYLDEKNPEPPLLPRDLHKQAVNYQAMSIIFSGIQPHQNLAVIRYFEEKINPEAKTAWINNAITKGFTALEKLLVNCVGNMPLVMKLTWLNSSYSIQHCFRSRPFAYYQFHNFWTPLGS